MKLAIVGGGIAGLAAAIESHRRGIENITLFESSERLGGKIRTSSFLGYVVEEGPDAFLTREPYALDLVHLLGLTPQLVSPRASAALINRAHHLYPLPSGLVLGAPTKVRQILQANVLTVAERTNALIHFLTKAASKSSTDNLGLAMRRRYGRALESYLIDPLVGGINASSIDHTSMEVVAPAISNLLSSRAEPTRSPLRSASGPLFSAPRDGLESIVHAGENFLVKEGISIERSTRVTGLNAHNHHWVVTTDLGDRSFDAVILAVPAAVASVLLRPSASEASELLRGIPSASVAIITVGLATPPKSIANHVSGILSPASEKSLTTAVSFANSKWPHWCDPGTGLLRISVGRRFDLRHIQLSDEALVATVTAEVSDLIGEKLPVTATRVTRWPDSFPQFLPYHRRRIELLRLSVSSLPPLGLAGAYIGGSGIPSCIKSAYTAVDQALNTP
jgi:oxygen-dependent protoporphyrinogen oxidase